MNLKRIIKALLKEDAMEKTINYNGNSLFMYYWKDEDQEVIYMSLSSEEFKELSILVDINKIKTVNDYLKKIRIKELFDKNIFSNLKKDIEKDILKKIYKIKLRATKKNINKYRKNIEMFKGYLQMIDFKKNVGIVNIKKMTKINRNLYLILLTEYIKVQDVLEEGNKKILEYIINNKIKIKTNKWINNISILNKLDIVKDIFNKKISNQRELYEYFENKEDINIDQVLEKSITTAFYLKKSNLRKRAYDLNKYLFLKNYLRNKTGCKDYLKLFILKELYLERSNVKKIIEEEEENANLKVLIEIIKNIIDEKDNKINKKIQSSSELLIENNYEYYLENINIDDFIVDLYSLKEKLINLEDFNYIYDYSVMKQQLKNF